MLIYDNITLNHVFYHYHKVNHQQEDDQIKKIEHVFDDDVQLLVLHYQEIDEENGKPKYAQLRMAAIIDEIGEKKPDPDNGKTYDRLLTTPSKAIDLLGWGEVAKCQIEEGFKLAKKELGLQVTCSEDEYV